MRSLIKHLSILFLLAVMALPAFGQARPLQTPLSGSEPSRGDSTARTRTEPFWAVRNFVSTPASCTVTTSSVGAVGTTAVTATRRINSDGYLFNYAPGASITGQTRTTSIAPMSYASKVQIGIFDISTGSVPICSAFTICGELWNGAYYCESQSSSGTLIGEGTWVTTNSAFMSVDRVRVSSCSGFDASDGLFLRQTSEVALGWRIGCPGCASTVPGTIDVEAVCQVAVAAGTIAPRCVPGSDLSFDTSIRANTVQLRDANLGSAGTTDVGCPADRSTFIVRYRANPNGRAR